MADPTNVPAASVGLDPGQAVASANLLPPPPANTESAADLLPAPPKPSQLAAGFGAGTGGLQAGAGGLVRGLGQSLEDRFGIGAPVMAAGEALTKAGQAREARNPAPVQDLGHLNAGNFGDFLAYSVGASAPQLAAAAASAMLTKRLGGGGLAEIAGAAAPIAAQTAGETYNEALEQKLPDPGMRAGLAGLLTGALFSVPAGKVLSLAGVLKDSPALVRLLGQVSGTNADSALLAAAKEAAVTGIVAGGASGGATLVQKGALGEDISSPQALSEAGLSAVGGAVLGAPLGAAASALGGHMGRVNDTRTPAQLEQQVKVDQLPPPSTNGGQAPLMNEPAEIRPLPEINKDIAEPLPNLGTGVPETGRNPTSINPTGVGMTMDEIANATFDPSRLNKVMAGGEPAPVPMDQVEAATAASLAAMRKSIVKTLNVTQYEKGGKYATGQVGVEGVNREKHLNRGVGRPPEGPSDRYSLEHGPQGGREDTFAEGIRSGDKQAIVEVARLKQRNGFALLDEESTALRRSDLPADAPDIPKGPLMRGQAFDKTTFIREHLDRIVREEGEGLPEKVLDKVSASISRAVDEASGKPGGIKTEAIESAIEGQLKMMKGILKVDKTQLAEVIANRLNEIPRTYYSGAATMALAPDGRVALTVRGDVKDGVVPAGTTAAIRGTDYREAGVGKEHVVRMDPAKIYNATDWHNDPLYKSEREKNGTIGAFMGYEREILAQGHEAILWPDGRVQLHVSQEATPVVPLENFHGQADGIAARHEKFGGSTTDLNTGRDLGGTQGYAVSTYKDRERKFAGYPAGAEIKQYMTEHHDALSLPGNTLGTWFNPDDGHTYLDVSTVATTLTEAQVLARAHDQLAVFNLSTMDVLPTDAPSIDRAVDMRAAGESTYHAGISAKGAEAVAYFEKVLGAPVKLEVGFAPQLRNDKGENVAGYYRAGKYKDMIALAYNAVEPIMSNAGHEAYHYLEQRVLPANERAIVARALAPGTDTYNRLMAQLRAYDIRNAESKTNIAGEAAASPIETRAYGFQMWRAGALKADTVLGRVWQKLADVLARMKNFVDGLGFKTYSDVFTAIERGEHARLERDGLRVNSNIEEGWFHDVEPDVVPGADGVYGSKMGPGPALNIKGPVSVAKGRPWWVRTPADVARMRGILRGLALDGERAGGRDWHVRSGDALMAFTQGDQKAATILAKLISNFSPRTAVGGDLLKAIRAITQYKAGVEVNPGAPKQHIESAIRIMRDNADLTGIKRGNFFNNLMQRIDPDNYGIAKQGATIDMWMAHSFGFARDAGGTVNKSEYNYANAEIQRLGRELGWRVDEVQAAVWVATKARANYVRGQMERFALSNGWYESKPTKAEAGGAQDMFGNVESKKRVLVKGRERDYVMNWMNMALQSDPPAEEFAKANYSYAEAFRDLQDGKLDLRLGDEAAAVAAQDYDLGFTGDDVHAAPDDLTLFSKAATVDLIQRARNGQDESDQLRRSVAVHIDNAGISDSMQEKLFARTKAEGQAGFSKIREMYDKELATGMHLARQSVGFKNVFNALTYHGKRVDRLISNAVERDLSLWKKAALPDERAATEVLLQRTINRWGDNSPDLSNMLAGLQPRQREMYEQARKMINAQLVGEFQADQNSYARVFGIKPEIMKLMMSDYNALGRYDENLMRERYGDGGASYLEWYSNRESQIRNLLEKGYFPERRYGDHAVHTYMTTDDGKKMTLSFELHENKANALIRTNDISKALAQFPEFKTEYSYKFKTDFNGSMSYAQFLDVARRQGVQLTQTEKERVARALMASDSTKNNRIFMRENVPGMSEQGSRILAEFGVGISKKIAYSELGHTIEDALNGASVDVKFDDAGRPTVTSDPSAKTWRNDGELAGWYHKLAQDTASFVTNPPEGSAISRQLRSVASLQFLGGSFAAGIVNLSALGMNTVPYLTKHTSYTDAFSKTMSALKLAVQHRDIINDFPRLLDPNVKMPGIDDIPGLRRAMIAGHQDIIDTQMFQIMGLTRGQQYSFSRPVQAALGKWMAPFMWSEQVNRIAGFVAAYRVGLAKGMGGEELQKFAGDTVALTHGRFDEANRPGLARGPVGSVLFTFKSWSLFTMELLGHMAVDNKKGAAFMLMSLAAAAGIEGLPFAQDMENIVDTISQRIFGTDFNSNRAMRNILKDASEAVAGTDLSQVLMHGAVNNLTGMSFASRVGVGHLIPGSRLGAADADFKHEMMEILGPAGGYPVNMIEGMGDLTRGQYESAMQKMLPLAAANATKAYLQWQRGYASDTGGRKLVDVSGPWELAQAFGFSSEALNQAYEIDRMDKQTLAFYQQVRGDFINDIRKAASLGKTDDLHDTLEAMATWNRTHPTMPIGLDAKSLGMEIAHSGMPLNQRTMLTLPKYIRSQSQFAIGLEENK